MNELIQVALSMGADNAALIPTCDISVEENLAGFCATPRCENYGLSKSCPPHVAGPSGFRDLLKHFKHAIVIKIDVPMDIILSDERRHVMKLLHETTAEVEQAAVKMGYPDSRAFAGGSCKQSFCHDHARCRVLSDGGKCRNPTKARESMSGFGINVQKLLHAAGWPVNSLNRDANPGAEAMTWVAGLVLIG